MENMASSIKTGPDQLSSIYNLLTDAVSEMRRQVWGCTSLPFPASMSRPGVTLRVEVEGEPHGDGVLVALHESASWLHCKDRRIKLAPCFNVGGLRRLWK